MFKIFRKKQQEIPTMAMVYDVFTAKAQTVIAHHNEVKAQQEELMRIAQEKLDFSTSEISEAEKFISKFTK